MVARNPSGEVVAYPAATNHHEQQILVWSALPSSIPAWLEQRAQELATTMACQLQLEGLLAVEMFVTQGDGLYVNELAPRPHNSYHASERCCVTSQFEQAVRAVCDLPLGDVRIVRPAAIANLLGDLWLTGRAALRAGAGGSRGEFAFVREAHGAGGTEDGPSVGDRGHGGRGRGSGSRGQEPALKTSPVKVR